MTNTTQLSVTLPKTLNKDLLKAAKLNHLPTVNQYLRYLGQREVNHLKDKGRI